MSVLHRITGLVLMVLVGFAGVFLMAISLDAANWAVVGSLVEPQRVVAGGVGAGLICLGLIFALSGLVLRRPERFLAFSNDGGSVNISTAAITDYLGKVGREFPSIIAMTPHVLPHHRSLDIVVDVRIKSGPQLHEICEVLQARIRESMATGLGISELRKVVVRVREISIEHKAD